MKICSVLLVSLLTPVICLPAAKPDQQIAQMLQETDVCKLKRDLLYNPSAEAVAPLFEHLRTHIDETTKPVILSTLNEALINRLGWQAPVGFTGGRSGFAASCTASPRNADNLYDAAGNRIEWKAVLEGPITKILDENTGSVLHTFEDVPFEEYRSGQRSSKIYTFAYSPDGTRIVLSLRKSIQIRDRTDGTLLKKFDVPNSTSITQVEFSPDSEKIISTDLYRETVDVFNAKSGDCIRTIHVGCLSRLSPDGKLRAGLSLTGGLKVIDEETGTCIKKFPARSEYRMNRFLLNWSPDGTFLLWSTPCGYSTEVECWNRYSNKQCHKETFQRWLLEIAQFTDNGDLIYFEEENAEWENPEWFICPNYMKDLERLVADPKYIPLLLTALEKKKKKKKPHTITADMHERLNKMGTTFFPFMKSKKLFKLAS